MSNSTFIETGYTATNNNGYFILGKTPPEWNVIKDFDARSLALGNLDIPVVDVSPNKVPTAIGFEGTGTANDRVVTTGPNGIKRLKIRNSEQRENRADNPASVVSVFDSLELTAFTVVDTAAWQQPDNEAAILWSLRHHGNGGNSTGFSDSFSLMLRAASGNFDVSAKVPQGVSNSGSSLSRTARRGDLATGIVVLAVSLSGDAGFCKLYQNGNLVPEFGDGESYDYAPTDGDYLGVRMFSGNPFNGQTPHWHRTLFCSGTKAGAEIQEISNNLLEMYKY